MNQWVMYGLMAISAAVLFGEPLLKIAIVKLVGLQHANHKTSSDNLPMESLPNSEMAKPSKRQLREQAFHAAEILVAYYDEIGDKVAADAAKEAGRLLFGFGSDGPTEPAEHPIKQTLEKGHR